MARRPIPLRVKVGLAGLAGVGLAWLIPRGSGEPVPTVTPSDRPGVTAAQIPLELIPEGISFRALDGIRVFLSRAGSVVVAFNGRSTGPGGGPIWWCPKNSSFENEAGDVRYDRDGHALLGTAPRDLDRVRVLVAAGSMTVFLQDVRPGAEATPGQGGRFAAPCSADERVG